jgi:LPXTG-motif cell wall-anchored protein
LKQTDPKPLNNHQFQFIDVDGKGPDLSAVGATVSGAVGTTVTMPVGVKNNGPRDLYIGPNGYPAAAALITIPAGATVTSYPGACGPNSKDILKGDPNRVQYACFTGPSLPAGETVTWKFGLKIDKAVTNATGSVQINPEADIPLYRDGNPANDTAAIVLNSTGATNPGAPNPGGGHDDVGLPITGPQTALFAAAGAALLAAGFAVFAVSRRRRTRFEA